jgi:predicted short-subunit dehydrogenase-like oxidoreductase (DUF2520 family)
MRMNIIGCGRAAGSLARLWVDTNDVSIGGVMNRTAASSRAAVADLGQGSVLQSFDEFEPAGFWLIGVNDDEIETVARNLSRSNLDLGGQVVFHLCGRFGPAILDSLANRGALIAAIHPVRSLTHEELSLEQFEGTPCIAEGDDQALSRLQPLYQSIGANWMATRHINRGLYHASLSIISNITKGIGWKTRSWLQDAGLDEDMAAQISIELLGSTLSDLRNYGPSKSITGPIVRGDTQTIEAHLAALAAAHPKDVDIYCVLARTVLELAHERGDLRPETLERLSSILENGADLTTT